uniref:Uncharacterized protein LOC100374965 n=1 Tax=Saccoglossus kowalevskii TaxID=10224 RepID=A0ABM0GKH6_SACKO|nr:PREDICTED: uncharacterized protein LOC100374965 [Saccoglossus kowalevskii]
MATLLRDNEYINVISHLGISDEERQNIETTFYPKEEQRYQLLLLWKRKSKEKGTADRLLKALHAADVPKVEEKASEATLKTLTAPEIHTSDSAHLSDDNLFSISSTLEPIYFFTIGNKLGINHSTLMKLEQSPAITTTYKMMALLQCWRDTTEYYELLSIDALVEILDELRLSDAIEQIGKMLGTDIIPPRQRRPSLLANYY